MATKTDHDPFVVLRERGTNGANHDLDTEAIIARLKKWQKLCSFRIAGAEPDGVKVLFDTLPRDMDAFVKDVYDFCPDLVDQGCGCVAEAIETALEAGETIPPELEALIEGVDLEDEDYGLEVLKRELLRDKEVHLWWD